MLQMVLGRSSRASRTPLSPLIHNGGQAQRVLRLDWANRFLTSPPHFFTSLKGFQMTRRSIFLPATKSLPSRTHFWVVDDVSCFLWTGLSRAALPGFLLAADGFRLCTPGRGSALPLPLPVRTGALGSAVRIAAHFLWLPPLWKS